MITLIQRGEIYKRTHAFIDSAFGTPASEQLILVEIGDSRSYDRVHIRNAIHMTLEEVRNQCHLKLPNRGAEIIIYGENRLSSEPRQALKILDQKGYPNLFYYPGGKEDWLAAGLDVKFGLVPADHFDSSKTK